MSFWALAGSFTVVLVQKDIEQLGELSFTPKKIGVKEIYMDL
jgi:hypothetical protein